MNRRAVALLGIWLMAALVVVVAVLLTLGVLPHPLLGLSASATAVMSIAGFRCYRKRGPR